MFLNFTLKQGFFFLFFSHVSLYIIYWNKHTQYSPFCTSTLLVIKHIILFHMVHLTAVKACFYLIELNFFKVFIFCLDFLFLYCTFCLTEEGYTTTCSCCINLFLPVSSNFIMTKTDGRKLFQQKLFRKTLLFKHEKWQKHDIICVQVSWEKVRGWEWRLSPVQMLVNQIEKAGLQNIFLQNRPTNP